MPKQKGEYTANNILSFLIIYSDPKPVPKIPKPYPLRRSARLNKSPEENDKKDADKILKTIPTKPSRSKTPPPPKTPPNTPTQSPKTPSTVANFEHEFQNLDNPYSFSGNVNEIANQIPSYRYVNRIKKLAKRLKFPDLK